MVSAGFAAGLAAAPHCAVMCGPLAMAACGSDRSRGSGSFGATVAYMLSRLGAYSLAGFCFGALGAGLLSRVDVDSAQKVAAIGVAVSLLWAAVRAYRAGGAQRATAKAELVQLRREKTRPTVVRGAVVGALTGMLPCGVLAGAWLLAASAGSGLVGALTMASYGVSSALGLGAVLTVGRMGSGLKLPRVVLVSGLVLVGLWAGARPWLAETPAGCHCGHGRVNPGESRAR